MLPRLFFCRAVNAGCTRIYPRGKREFDPRDTVKRAAAILNFSYRNSRPRWFWLHSAVARPRLEVNAIRLFALEQQGKFEQAEAAWRAVMNAHSGRRRGLCSPGRRGIPTGALQAAVPLYRKALELNPSTPGFADEPRAGSLQRRRTEGCDPGIHASLKSEPASSPDAQRVTALLGIAEYGLGNYAQAIPYLNTAAANDPQNLQFRAIARAQLPVDAAVPVCPRCVSRVPLSKRRVGRSRHAGGRGRRRDAE